MNLFEHKSSILSVKQRKQLQCWTMNNDIANSPRAGRQTPRSSGRAAAAAKKASESDGDNEGDTKKKFPWALHSLLEEAEKAGDSDVICWRPSGVAFKVLKRDEFMKRILPKYFKQTKFKSFVRQLNLWGFTFIDQGPDKGSYYHSKFVRGKQHLCQEMRRQKVKSTSVLNMPQQPPTFPQQGQSSIAAAAPGGGDLSMEPYDPGNERTVGLETSFTIEPNSIPELDEHREYVQQQQQQRLQAPSPAYPIGQQYGSFQRNSHEAFFYANQSNSNLMFRTGDQITTEQDYASSGDWLDRLEAMFCPTDVQMPVTERESIHNNGPLNPSWLEPRPIGSNATAGRRKDPPIYDDNHKLKREG